jgi:O-antigen/teichoic acid export membrane protein
MKAYSKIVENGSYIMFAVAFYLILGTNEFGLATGKMIGVLVAFLVLVGISKFKFNKYSWQSHLSLLKKYREFPTHYMPSSFVNIISLQILVIFIGTYFTKEQLGYFGLANMVVLLPISFITQSVGTIFFQKTSEHINRGEKKAARKVFYQTLSMLALIAIPAFLILYFGSRHMFPIVFGDNWIVTGIIAELLAVVFLSQIVVGPLSIVLISLKRIKLNAFWQYGRFIIMALYMLSLIYIFELPFLEFIRWYAYGAAVLYFVYFLIINNEIRKLGYED